MHNQSFPMPKLHSSTIPALRLLGCWFAGLSLGFPAARFYGDMLADLILQSAGVRGTPLGMLFTTMLPLLFSACAVFLFDARMLYPLCLLRGLGLGIVLGAVVRACAGGLLLGLLLLFSALFYTPVLIWYWLRRIYGASRVWWDTLLALAIGLGIWAVDYLLIAPFLAYAINL